MTGEIQPEQHGETVDAPQGFTWILREGNRTSEEVVRSVFGVAVGQPFDIVEFTNKDGERQTIVIKPVEETPPQS